MRINFLVAHFPPQICGVGDHTYHLARHVAALGHKVQVTTSYGLSPLAGAGIEVCPTIRHWGISGIRALAEQAMAQSPDWIVLQWVPHLYSRWGLSPALPLLVGRLKRAGARIAVIAHELWAPLDRPSYWVAGPVHRWGAWQLLRCSDRFFVTTPRWQQYLRRFGTQHATKLKWLPVGSNIEVNTAKTRERLREKLGLRPAEKGVVLFRPIGGNREAGLADMLYQGFSARREVRWIVVGTTREEASLELPHLSRATEAIFTGVLPAEKISHWLQASDVFLGLFRGGLSGRHSSLMAALSHGLAILGTRGPLTEEQVWDSQALVLCERKVDELALALDELLRDSQRREALGQAARHLYETRFSWPQISRHLLTALAGRSEGMLSENRESSNAENSSTRAAGSHS